MADRPHPKPTLRGVLRRLASLRRRIAAAEAKLEGLYAQRTEALQQGRSIDPTTGKRMLMPDGRPQQPLVQFPDLSEAAGVSEEAIHKALKKAARKLEASE